ncbi:MAG: hypothetical protein K0Q73_9307 [Paenibacillus sp.]|nr:hypothetical protein [Paenibacillus sp.]
MGERHVMGVATNPNPYVAHGFRTVILKDISLDMVVIGRNRFELVAKKDTVIMILGEPVEPYTVMGIFVADGKAAHPVSEGGTVLDVAFPHPPAQKDSVHPVLHKAAVPDLGPRRAAARMDAFARVSEAAAMDDLYIRAVLVADPVAMIVSNDASLDPDMSGIEKINAAVAATLGKRGVLSVSFHDQMENSGMLAAAAADDRRLCSCHPAMLKKHGCVNLTVKIQDRTGLPDDDRYGVTEPHAFVGFANRDRLADRKPFGMLNCNLAFMQIGVCQERGIALRALV